MRKREKILAVISGSILITILCAGAAFTAAPSNDILILEETAIHYQVVYNMEITSAEMAAAAIAEAVADVYLNGENAADASKAITEIVDKILVSKEEIFKY